MLYRIAMVQLHNNKFVVYKINHTRLQDDRKTVAYYLRDQLGPLFPSFKEAADHYERVLGTLIDIERNDRQAESAANSEDEQGLLIIRQRGTVLRTYLNDLTKVPHG